DFENPFHVYLFEPEQLASMLSLFFDDVECLGIEGDEVLQADFAARRASGERILRLDVLGLRRRLPRRAYVWSYEHALPVVYRMLGSKRSGVGTDLAFDLLRASSAGGGQGVILRRKYRSGRRVEVSGAVARHDADRAVHVAGPHDPP